MSRRVKPHKRPQPLPDKVIAEQRSINDTDEILHDYVWDNEMLDESSFYMLAEARMRKPFPTLIGHEDIFIQDGKQKRYY